MEFQKFLNDNQGVTQAVGLLLIILGWWINSSKDRDLLERQFILDKKYLAAEKILNQLTNYSSGVSDVLGIINRWELTLGVQWLRNSANWNNLTNEVLNSWFKAYEECIKLLQIYENYQIALKDIDELISKFKEKTDITAKFFTEKYLLSDSDILNLPSDTSIQNYVKVLLQDTKDVLFTYQAYVYGMTVDIQNRLLAKVFKTTLQSRKT